MSDTNACRIAIPIGSDTPVLRQLGREPEAVPGESSIGDALGQGALRPDLDGSVGTTQAPYAIIDQLNVHLKL
ncbi:MAG TPA: hypothetical protein VL418_06080 [Devosiaceae bacterium]|nr:hypothetical protein [Devosiaceae bacterium]